MVDLVNLVFYRGRVGLYALLKALGVGLEDQVAVQAFTCLAVPEGIMATGAQPLWVDIEPSGYNMDVQDLKRKITTQTKAIIVQHTYGIPADMDALRRVADEHNIPIIEDCAHTLLSEYRSQRVGTFGVGSFYSFEWGKPVVAGVGGSAMANQPELQRMLSHFYTSFVDPPKRVRFKLALQYYGFRVLYRPAFYWPVRSLFHLLGESGLIESNYNPVEGEKAPDFGWRMAPESRRRLAREISRVQDIAKHSAWVVEQYRDRIQGDWVVHPKIHSHTKVFFARYPLRTHNKKRLLELARQKRVELANWYNTPIHPLQGTALQAVGYRIGACPNAERRSQEVVTLPVHLRVTQREIDKIVSFFSEMDDDFI